MKRIVVLSGFFLAIINFGYAQSRLNNNAQTGSVYSHSAFLDASSSPTWNSTVNEAKGLMFPRTDLTAMSVLLPNTSLPTNNPNRFDGMVVFNTATGTAAIGGTPVIPGFYYYRNSSTTSNNGGTWISMVPTIDYTVSTISLTAPATITASNSTVFCSGSFLLTLPAASTVNGKIFKISKVDEANTVLTFSEDIYITAVSKFKSLNYPKSFTIQSNGTVWSVLN